MRYIITLCALCLALTLIWATGRINQAESKASDAEARAEAAQSSATYWQRRSESLEAELVETIYAFYATPPTTAPLGELLIPCGLTLQEFESGLHDGLKPYAKDFLKAERETDVNAAFLAAVAALESGWATSDASTEKNNLFGWMGTDGYMNFDSKTECVAYVAERIKALYLSPDGVYFSGYTVEDVNIQYNGNPEWAEAVRQIMSDILEQSQEG